jgi:Zn finger protein HypA/HybF involved in hydrogenase expression
VKKFNGCVREAMVQAVGARKGYGMLFVDEVGFETRGHLPNSQRVAHGLNLHCHGLYLGPPLENRATCASCRSFVKKRKAEKKWDCFRCGSAVCDVKPGRLTQIFMEETRRAFGVESRGVWIKAVKKFAEDSERAVRWALHHMLKYLSKPPAVTPERLASLIAAFHTARRVHSLGLFYGEKPKGEKRNCPCPNCKAMGIVSAVSFEGRALSNGGCIPRIVPIKDLLARGYVPLREAGRDATLSMGISREESWGASP